MNIGMNFTEVAKFVTVSCTFFVYLPLQAACVFKKLFSSDEVPAISSL